MGQLDANVEPLRHVGVLSTQIRNTKPEFSNVQNVTSRKDLSDVSVIWILVIRICFETGDPPEGWGVRRTNFDIRISDLH